MVRFHDDAAVQFEPRQSALRFAVAYAVVAQIPQDLMQLLRVHPDHDARRIDVDIDVARANVLGQAEVADELIQPGIELYLLRSSALPAAASCGDSASSCPA